MPTPPPDASFTCDQHCKRVLHAVKDAVTGAVIFTFVLVYAAIELEKNIMKQPLFFHDGNITSLDFSKSKKGFKCTLKLDLYDSLKCASRQKRKLVFNELRNIYFNGDCGRLDRNYTFGIIEDGVIENFSDYQKLSISLTGGSLVIEGKLVEEI